MCLQNVINLGVSPVEACVKIDDTRPGIEEGLNGGMWTIGLAHQRQRDRSAAEGSGESCRRPNRSGCAQGAYTRMYQSGAHYVVDTIADIVPCLDDIESRLARGERP